MVETSRLLSGTLAGETVVDVLKKRFHLGHRRILAAVEDLTDDQMRWQPSPTAHPIAFNVWHLARWNDHLQAKIPEMTLELSKKLGRGQQIWEAEALAEKWGLEADTLGSRQSGTGMDDGVAGNLRLPHKEVLVDYLRRAFGAAEHAVDAIDEKDFAVKYRSPHVWEGERLVGLYVINYLAHDDFHLGQIVCLRRLLGLGRVWS